MAPIKTFVTDLRHFAAGEGATLPAAARRLASFLSEVVEAATSRSEPGPWTSAVRCFGRLERKACRGWLRVQRYPTHVAWSCERCGRQGTVTGFEGSDHDLSRYRLAVSGHTWGFDEESRVVLLDATISLPSLRAVIARVGPVEHTPELLLLRASLDELDDVYTLVEDLSDLTRSRRRLELLDGLRFSLSSSMDGF